MTFQYLFCKQHSDTFCFLLMEEEIQTPGENPVDKHGFQATGKFCCDATLLAASPTYFAVTYNKYQSYQCLQITHISLVIIGEKPGFLSARP